jgi:hypothetical protein
MSDESSSRLHMPRWVIGAELAMMQAGAGVVLDHLVTGEPLVVERDGKVALVPAVEYVHVLRALDRKWVEEWMLSRLREGMKKSEPTGGDRPQGK